MWTRLPHCRFYFFFPFRGVIFVSLRRTDCGSRCTHFLFFLLRPAEAVQKIKCVGPPCPKQQLGSNVCAGIIRRRCPGMASVEHFSPPLNILICDAVQLKRSECFGSLSVCDFYENCLTPAQPASIWGPLSECRWLNWAGVQDGKSHTARCMTDGVL